MRPATGTRFPRVRRTPGAEAESILFATAGTYGFNAQCKDPNVQANGVQSWDMGKSWRFLVRLDRIGDTQTSFVGIGQSLCTL